MPHIALNPFIYPGPVPVERFVDREAALRTLLSRIATGQNTAIVGPPHIGKSSLLRYLAQAPVCRERLGAQAAQTLFVFQDCHLLPGSAAPDGFWRQVLAEIWERCDDEAVRRIVDWAVNRGELGSYALDRIFRTVTRRGWRVALLVDEFDSLLHHQGFNTAEFFGALRSLATLHSGLALVTTSRLSVAAMNRHSETLNPYGSSFFNGFTEINLRPFADEETAALLDGALAGTGLSFDADDRAFVQSMAGGHPFLLQAAAGALYDAIAAGEQGAARYQRAGRTFHRQTEDHFDDFWRHIPARARTVATILSLAELGGRVAGREFDVGDIGALDRYGRELRDLEDEGLIELRRADGWQADWQNWVFWRGERWRVRSRRLVWWVGDQVLARQEVDWEEWLDAKRYGLLLTHEEKETLQKLASQIPKEAINTTAKFLGLIIKEIIGS